MNPTRSLSSAPVALRFGRNPKLQSRKSGLEDRFEDQLRSLLRHSVAHRGDTQRPFPAVRLGDLHPTHRHRVVGACPKVRGELIQHPSNAVVLHRLQGQPVDPSGATIGSDPIPRHPQDVTPADLVEHSVEPPTLRLLGRSP